MDIHRWLYKFSKIFKKCTQRVNMNDIFYPGHKVVRSRANIIATNKGLGTALLIAPPVLVLIAAGIAASSSVRVLPPADHSPPDVPQPPTNITATEKIISSLQSQLQVSLTGLEKKNDHVNVITAAIVAIGLIGAVLTIGIIRRRGRGGGGRGKNATDSRHTRGMNDTYREGHVQTGSVQDQNFTLNAGSGKGPFQPR
ncbi:unnamed protein product [Rhizoctonia solani]|uniref:Uncharacterized protein n=1 Tax=Rhizoctonia solani TaxID=456999 RepID=A0A8H3CAD7_9AGAM|nr:unnamed protein product [Rhizoctonia solani]